MTDEPWFCRYCGLVRWADRQPWCRHNDIALPARRMAPLPAWHPIAQDIREGKR
jgi:hypothetical protein